MQTRHGTNNNADADKKSRDGTGVLSQIRIQGWNVVT